LEAKSMKDMKRKKEMKKLDVTSPDDEISVFSKCSNQAGAV
jgi:hypothetical protein